VNLTASSPSVPPLRSVFVLQEEQDFSRNNSVYLNVAYKTLKDPTLRAKYLVSIVGKGSGASAD
jgi:hypothetical protein